MASVLPFRLKRLKVMCDAAVRLVNRNWFDRNVFQRGAPEMVIINKRNEYTASLYDLLLTSAKLSPISRSPSGAYGHSSRRVRF